jgi:hypothetical protein
MYDDITSSDGLLPRSSSPSFTSEEKLEIPRRRSAQFLPKTTYILTALSVLSLVANVVVVVILNAVISKSYRLLEDETRSCKPQTKLYCEYLATQP